MWSEVVSVRDDGSVCNCACSAKFKMVDTNRVSNIRDLPKD